MKKRATGTTVTLAALVALFALTGCKDGPTGPKAGMLTVNLTTTATDDRAIIVSVSGPGAITTIEAANPAYVVHSRSAGTSFRAAVFGELATGPLLRFAVPDVRQVEDYTALVLEVADAQNSLRPVGGPAVAVTK